MSASRWLVPRRAPVLALAVLLTVACELKDTPVAESTPAPAGDSVTPVIAAGIGDAALSAPRTAAPLPHHDSSTVGSRVEAGFGARAGAAPDAPAGGGLRTADADLLALKLGIVIPVQGVRAGSLTDMYDEARGTRVHEAIDILAPRGTPVVSATAGRVVQLHNSKAGGLMVYAADANDRFILLYGHLDSYAPGLREGSPLVAGQQIGAVGTTGNAPPGTPHLHFAVLRGRPSVAWWKGTPLNPYPLFRP